MNREEQWLLPEGVEETLPVPAAVTERLRRRLLDLYAGWGYELVSPPLIEFLDSLLNGAGRDLERQTFKITDQMSGRLMGVRADITPQVARLDAHSLRRNGPCRLCYCSTALRTRPSQPGGSRIPYQIGVELFGHAGMESDYEVMTLMLETLAEAGVDNITLDLGHVAVYRALVQAAGLSEDAESELEDIYRRKAAAELDAFIAEHKLSDEAARALSALPWLAGEPEVLREASEKLGSFGQDVVQALDELAALTQRLQVDFPAVSLHIDLGELRGYHYHTGVVFAAWVNGFSEPLAKGGRYDRIGEVFGRARPATGFSADLKQLLPWQARPSASGIFVPENLDADGVADEVRRLRQAGERVVQALPGVDNDPATLGCDRQLVADGKGFAVQAIQS
jgi:ATP phosphoribosyltransferase regulatory subunit